MGDRFYNEQLDKFGTCAGWKGTKRGRRMAWTDESKAEAVEMYTASEPTPDTSMEVVKEIADELGESPNGVRMILTRAGVYVKKTPASKSTSTGSTGGGRVSKADAQDALSAALTDAGMEVDESIISKLTGKAAVYLTGIVEKLNS
jgi:transposase-like protein|tara:strand:- start:957 stop:1394 length:438 start_codon:yes stop_codon:yes gene_type:complete